MLINTMHIGLLFVLTKLVGAECCVYWLSIIFTHMYSIFCWEVSYHFIMERDYGKLNLTYQSY